MLRVCRGVIFDVDGTLTRPVYDFKVLRRRLQDAIAGRFLDGVDVLDELHLLSPRSKERAEHVIHQFEEEGRDKFAWNDGAFEVLRFLDSKGVKRGVVTRNSDVTLRVLFEQMRKHNLKDFDVALSRTFLPTKPHPAPALHIAKQWRKETRELLFIGDGFHDMKCR
jgi:HAD superfamily hydrolase (TIGR01549 family)